MVEDVQLWEQICSDFFDSLKRNVLLTQPGDYFLDFGALEKVTFVVGARVLSSNRQDSNYAILI